MKRKPAGAFFTPTPTIGDSHRAKESTDRYRRQTHSKVYGQTQVAPGPRGLPTVTHSPANGTPVLLGAI